jgi:hypothetical protein
MKILIHSTTLDGEPLQADSIALNGKNCAVDHPPSHRSRLAEYL